MMRFSHLEKKPQIISPMLSFTPEISTNYISQSFYPMISDHIPLYLIVSNRIQLYITSPHCWLYRYTPMRYPHKRVGPEPTQYPTSSIQGPSKDS